MIATYAQSNGSSSEQFLDGMGALFLPNVVDHMRPS